MTDRDIIARGERSVIDLSPHRESFVVGFRVSSIRREIRISSEDGNTVHILLSHLTDETCVFSPQENGLLTDSFVIGTYDDHDDVVEAVRISALGFGGSDVGQFGELADFVIRHKSEEGE